MTIYVLPPQYYIPAHFNLPNPLPRQNPYPNVDTTQFTESATEFQSLMKSAHKIIDRFANSKEFAYQVMDAAQKSDHETVKKLIEKEDLAHPVEIKFNPDGIDITLIAKTKDIDCCKLVMALHW
ncbi:hypothetical protein [Salinibacillus xinjiangensis]|uniref:Uncharacterized protein n=1 Tax=Salinibacillus xinjiangensis TaxID=1229268 RepID=A0A6G1X2I0_9BACI|nr:hypothetical protein [Salinibacillus xinjiangensis]MRG85193.1 hypothetical protein [Salinibacillus xinjiangensis]